MPTNAPNPTPQPPGPAGPTPTPPPHPGDPTPVKGVDVNRLYQLLQALGRYGPVLLETIQKLAELLRQPGPAPAQAGPPAGAADHAACCRAELEHLLAATAICLHHCRCCEEGGGRQDAGTGP